MKNRAVTNDLGHRKPRPPFDPGTMHKVSLSSSCSHHKRGKRSSVKKTTAVLKRTMTEKNDRWKGGEWLHENKVAAARREQRVTKLCRDTWKHVKPKGKWIEVSADYRVFGALVKEKKVTWTESGRESAKREADLYGMLEKAAADEKREERERDKLVDKPQAFLTMKEEEDEATCLMEEMRKNVEAAQHKSFEAEQSLCNALREYVDSYDRDQGRARTPMTKCWQSMQSRDTKNLNLGKRLGRHIVHSQESGLVRRRENGTVVEAAGG